ncbi:hypothetical protein T06_16527 [Trichinella sp. T6]|nr:hypothetical protein T06_16527 [Trichinella sp. T6]
METDGSLYSTSDGEDEEILKLALFIFMIAPPSTHHFNPHFGIINCKFEYYMNLFISMMMKHLDYDSKLATPSIPHDFNPTRIIILTIMLLCFYRLQSCASDSHFWFQMHCGKTKLLLGKDMHEKITN